MTDDTALLLGLVDHVAPLTPVAAAAASTNGGGSTSTSTTNTSTDATAMAMRALLAAAARDSPVGQWFDQVLGRADETAAAYCARKGLTLVRLLGDRERRFTLETLSLGGVARSTRDLQLLGVKSWADLAALAALGAGPAVLKRALRLHGRALATDLGIPTDAVVQWLPHAAAFSPADLAALGIDSIGPWASDKHARRAMRKTAGQWLARYPAADWGITPELYAKLLGSAAAGTHPPPAGMATSTTLL